MKSQNSKNNISIEEVVNNFDHVIGKIVNAADEFPWNDEVAYAHWLAQTYYLVRHTTRFICLTAGHLSLEQEEFHQFLLKHLKEETGHEMLALNDLQEGLHWSVQDTPERIESQLMLQSQYFWIKKNPFAHFGFFWVLEKLSVERGGKIIPTIRKAFGNATTSFLDLHSQEDITHVQTIFSKVNKIPPQYLYDLNLNIIQTGELYTQMLNEIAALARQHKKQINKKAG